MRTDADWAALVARVELAEGLAREAERQRDGMSRQLASARAYRDAASERADRLAAERDEARAEVERLRREAGVHPSSLTDVVTALEDERDEALAEVERLRAEVDDAMRILDRLGDLLTQTANALKGDPGELRSWSWHDVPMIASLAMEWCADACAEVERLRRACDDTEWLRARLEHLRALSRDFREPEPSAPEEPRPLRIGDRVRVVRCCPASDDDDCGACAHYEGREGRLVTDSGSAIGCRVQFDCGEAQWFAAVERVEDGAEERDDG